MKDFSELTSRGQARRLRQVALAALQHYDLPVSRVRLLTNSWNGIFRLDTESGEKYVLRVNLPEVRSLAEIRAEMTWLAALRRDTDQGVPLPLSTREGDLVVTATAEGVPEPRHCAVFSWVPGTNLARRLTPENVGKLGVLTAQLHNHADTFVPPAGFRLKTYDRVLYLDDWEAFPDPAYAHVFPPERRRVYLQAMEHVQAALDRLNADRSQLRVLHSDLHQWNVRVQRGRLYALDFDDCIWGYPVQDLGITFYYLRRHEQYDAMREAFQRGYCRHRAWPEQVPGEIETFIAGRGVILMNHIVRDANPDFREHADYYAELVEKHLQEYLQQVNGG